jgi:hypothetical protein
MVSPFGGTLHVIGFTRNYAGWAMDGRLLATRSSERWFGEQEFGRPVGVVNDRVVVHYQGMVMRTTEGIDKLPQGLRLHDLRDGHATDVREGFPDLVMRTWREGEVMQSASTEGSGVIVAARGGTIARTVYGQRAITTLDTAGSPVASRELDQPIDHVAIDADGRIWAIQMEGRALAVVFTPDLSEELFRVAVPGFMDASGDFILAAVQGAFGTRRTVLLKMRPETAAGSR